MGITTRTVGLLTAALLATGLAGCAKPTASEVYAESRTLAEQAQAQIETDLEPLGQVGELVGSSVLDDCQTGQRNWKVDDGFDVRCEVLVRRAYVLPTGDFREAADAVNRTMTSPGCAVEDTEAEETLRNYWDKLKGTQTRNFDGPYRPDNLPGYSLGCATGGPGEATEGAPLPATHLEARGWATLPADDDTLMLHKRELGQPCLSSAESPCTWSGDSAEDVLTAQTADGWMLFVWGRVEYVRTGSD